MPLTILNVAYPLASVGPHAVGGAEQVVSFLDREITAAGHRSLLVAREDSECAGRLFPIPALRGTLQHHAHPVAQAHCREAIAAALAEYPVDIVHLHGIDFPAYLPVPGTPVLVTLHLPPAWYASDALWPRRPHTYLHCVSRSQRSACPAGLALLPEIENAVPVDALTARHGKRRYVLSLGRICWEKGFHVALDAAKAARFPMLLAGQVFPYAQHEAYFRELIVPRLDATRRFIGPIGFARKRRLLTAARALIVSSLVPETGSLAAMEALACGTPVIAFRSGALTNVVEHGVTGFLVDEPSQIPEAIHAAATLNPEACRATARRRFSMQRMRDQYFATYCRLARVAVAAERAIGTESENTPMSAAVPDAETAQESYAA